MTTQERNNTAAGMVRDALERIVALESVQSLRHYEDTKDEAAHWLDFAETALAYFAAHYRFDEPVRNDRFADFKSAYEAWCEAPDGAAVDASMARWLFATFAKEG